MGLDPRLAQPAGWAQALGCVQAHPLKPMTENRAKKCLVGRVVHVMPLSPSVPLLPFVACAPLAVAGGR